MTNVSSTVWNFAAHGDEGVHRPAAGGGRHRQRWKDQLVGISQASEERQHGLSQRSLALKVNGPTTKHRKASLSVFRGKCWCVVLLLAALSQFALLLRLYIPAERGTLTRELFLPFISSPPWGLRMMQEWCENAESTRATRTRQVTCPRVHLEPAIFFLEF